MMVIWTHRTRCKEVIAFLVCAIHITALGEPVAARQLEGTLHGFLSLSNANGKLVAVGDLFQDVQGDRVTSRLLFRFKDGSIDDETTVFTQRGNFLLISNHHIQKGPSFPHPLDLSIDAQSGQVTVRSLSKDGKEESTVEHLDLPPDLYNGLIIPVTKNLRTDAPETRVSMIVASPKPRLVKLALLPLGDEAFSLAGFQRKSSLFEINIELGGVVGLVAPLIGKQPPKIKIWILGGQNPTFLKEEGPLFEGGSLMSINLTSPVWRHVSQRR